MASRYLFLVPNFGGGGAEFVAREWAMGLAAGGDEVAVLLTHARLSDSASPGVELIRASGRGALSALRAARNAIKMGEFDAVVSLMPYFNVLALLSVVGLRGKRPRMVISGRNVDVPLRSVNGLRFRILQLAAWVLYRRADAFVAISHPVAAEAAALYRVDPARIFVVPNPALGKRPQGTITFSDDADVLNIIVPARVVAQKRPLIAVEVAKLLQVRFPKTTVHYFGVGTHSEQVVAAAAAAGVSIEMHGWVDRWFDECPPSSVVLLPSLAEGFGNVLVEGAAVGIPSVASSRCLGAADAIVPGVTGELVIGDAAEDYAAGVVRMARHTVSGADGWLSRFRPEASVDALRLALRSPQVTEGRSVA